MPTHKTIDVLKEAILLERRGKAFYRKVADQSDNPDIKGFFEAMAAEEGRHIDILESQFASYVQNQRFEPLSSQDRQSQSTAGLVLTDAVKEQIAAAEFEAAAISAAMLMEEKAVSVYSDRAAAARDPAEETLYLWLADWERGHLSYLVQLDRQIKESIWNDRQFWPF